MHKRNDTLHNRLNDSRIPLHRIREDALRQLESGVLHLIRDLKRKIATTPSKTQTTNTIHAADVQQDLDDVDQLQHRLGVILALRQQIIGQLFDLHVNRPTKITDVTGR